MGKTKTAFVSEVTEEPKKSRTKEPKKSDKVHIAGLKGGQRIKMVEVETLPTEELKKERTEEREKEVREPKVRGKKYQESKAKFDTAKLYPIPQAIKYAKETSYSKFDGTIELHLIVKKVGTSANVTLPYSAGKAKKVEVASEETIKKLQAASGPGGKIDFDILLATAEMMPKLIPYAKILGPKGLMPNPKNRTIISSAKDAEKFSANSLTLRTEKEAPLIHTVIGKVSQKDDELVKNAEAILSALGGNKVVLKAFAKATMGPSVKLAL